MSHKKLYYHSWRWSRDCCYWFHCCVLTKGSFLLHFLHHFRVPECTNDLPKLRCSTYCNKLIWLASCVFVLHKNFPSMKETQKCLWSLSRPLLPRATHHFLCSISEPERTHIIASHLFSLNYYFCTDVMLLQEIFLSLLFNAKSFIAAQSDSLNLTYCNCQQSEKKKLSVCAVLKWKWINKVQIQR